jgi:hypothetical protein
MMSMEFTFVCLASGGIETVHNISADDPHLAGIEHDLKYPGHRFQGAARSKSKPILRQKPAISDARAEFLRRHEAVIRLKLDMTRYKLIEQETGLCKNAIVNHVSRHRKGTCHCSMEALRV